MIGIFDSGLGGLTALKEAMRHMPHRDFIYFGDTARVPYGTRSPETILTYTRQAMQFFASHKVSAVLTACGTVSSVALKTVQKEYPFPILGVVEPSVAAAVQATKTGRIGVIGTASTIQSHSFEEKIRALLPQAQTMGIACPLFVPLVENGWISPDDSVTLEVARRYLAPFSDFAPDTLILGCTHFPMIAPILQKVLPKVTLIHSGPEAGRALHALLGDAETGAGSVHYYVSDNPENFRTVASIFLEDDFRGTVHTVDLHTYEPSSKNLK